MSREAIREMKRTLRSGRNAHSVRSRQLAEQAALALLERSIRMRHWRLAVQRLDEAVAMARACPRRIGSTAARLPPPAATLACRRCSSRRNEPRLLLRA
jgi:hypothetical protein